jgi:hypothetical protein
MSSTPRAFKREPVSFTSIPATVIHLRSVSARLKQNNRCRFCRLCGFEPVSSARHA